MVRAAPSKNRCRRLGAYVGLLALALQLVSDIDLTWNFSAPSMTPTTKTTNHDLRTDSFKYDESITNVFAGRQHMQSRYSPITRQAAELTIGAKIINAMGAGAVASIIQAALSAVGEPIVNRVLVKRMKVMEAINDVSPAQMLNFFKTTLTTNFLKFPFFEAINALMAALPIAPSIRGIVTGLVFTSATLPVTNFRYRKSMDLPVNWGNIYEAYVPTVIRDIVYGIARNYFTIWTLALYPQWTIASPQVLFIVVIAGCLVSAPFNEWRGFLLQSKGQELTFSEFFKPSNFVRSTSLGALKQGIALAVGYWCAPPAQQFVKGLIASIKGV